jgi:voltage-gated potassium channel
LKMHSSRLRTALDAAVVVGALATIPLTVLQEQGIRSRTLDAIDWAVWGIFAVEFLLSACSAPRIQLRRFSTVAKFAVVVLSFPQLPGILALVRLGRLGRLVRLMRLSGVTARGLGAIKEVLGRRGLIYVAAVTTLLILVGGGCLSILEPQTVKGGYGDGIWWAIVTASTVGYGDISPVTLWGRIIAVLLMLVGIGLVSTLAASITSYFVQQTANSEFKELSSRLDRIRNRTGATNSRKTSRNRGAAKRNDVNTVAPSGFPRGPFSGAAGAVIYWPQTGRPTMKISVPHLTLRNGRFWA